MELRTLLEDQMQKSLHWVVISGARRTTGASKVKIRPVQIKDRLFFQCSETHGAKELHANYEKEEMILKILGWLEQDFKQLQLEADTVQATVLVSKKGKMTIRQKACECQNSCERELSHNRKKKYILEEGKPVPFLVDLGVMTKDGKIVHARYDKFRQINRFLEFVADVLPQLPKDRELTILDFGCGKSYLTFAIYYYLCVLNGFDVRMVGLDLKEDVIDHCNRLSEKYGYEKLKFLKGDIASYTGTDQVDMVVTLHACDTATDYALEKAIQWDAKVILSVPCCQHELNGQIENELLAPIMNYGILKERMAALLTDGIRAELLEEHGYDTQILEFIEMEHTPKNLLIRAIQRPGAKKVPRKNLRECIEFFHADPALARLLGEKEGRA